MNRRSLLISLGASGVAGGVGYYLGQRESTVETRIWVTERAAGYEGLPETIEAHLRRSFETVFGSVRLSHGGVVAVSSEDGYDAVIGGEWPSAVLQGFTGTGAVDPVDGINLLVTDGDPNAKPVGAGVPYVAAVGGARALARLPSGDPLPALVPASIETATLQVLVHECGHALGLQHKHGTIEDRDDVVAVSPMVGGYAWDPEIRRRDPFDFVESACGTRYPLVTDFGRLRLSVTYSACARQRLRRAGGPLLDALPDALPEALPDALPNASPTDDREDRLPEHPADLDAAPCRCSGAPSTWPFAYPRPRSVPRR